jgi:hypothetical protein
MDPDDLFLMRKFPLQPGEKSFPPTDPHPCLALKGTGSKDNQTVEKDCNIINEFHGKGKPSNKEKTIS